jgi:hypothetical protein
MMWSRSLVAILTLLLLAVPTARGLPSPQQDQEKEEGEDYEGTDDSEGEIALLMHSS